jgi:hypothetical protein
MYQRLDRAQQERECMSTVEILAIQPVSDAERSRIEAVDSSLHLTDAGGWFDGEIREGWPEFTTRRYLAPDANGKGTREERDALLANAEIILGGFPYPLELRGRAPKLKWFHQRPAGASNLLRGDLWGSDVVVTTSRGFGNTLPIAEYTLASILHFAKGLHRVEVDRSTELLDHRPFKPLLIEGKTVCVIGAGGIGTLPSFARPSGCGWSGPGGGRWRTANRCRTASTRCIRRATCIVCWARATLSRCVASGHLKRPT